MPRDSDPLSRTLRSEHCESLRDCGRRRCVEPSNEPNPAAVRTGIGMSRTQVIARRRRARSLLGGAALALLMMAPASFWLVPAQGSGIATDGSTGWQCSSVVGATPAAISILLRAPGMTLVAGDKVVFYYELQVVNFSAALNGVRIKVPSAEAAFPTSMGTPLRYWLLDRWFTIHSSNWTNASLATSTHAVTASVTLVSTTKMTLSSQRLAVMDTAGFGAVQLALRWQWQIQSVNGSTSTGPWSVPSSGLPHPAIFDPAPYVWVSSTSANPAVIGTDFTANLLGNISKQPFYLELEHPASGIVVRTQGVKGPLGNLTPFAAAILFNSKLNDLGPGMMLLHIHNRCGSLVLSLSVAGVYAPHATLQLNASPSGCGPIKFNGTSFASGAQVVATPSNGTYNLSAGACPGHSFQTWNSTGGLDVTTALSSSTSVRVTYNGTLTARYA
jgi:hypothetical protein